MLCRKPSSMNYCGGGCLLWKLICPPFVVLCSHVGSGLDLLWLRIKRGNTYSSWPLALGWWKMKQSTGETMRDPSRHQHHHQTQGFSAGDEAAFALWLQSLLREILSFSLILCSPLRELLIWDCAAGKKKKKKELITLLIFHSLPTKDIKLMPEVTIWSLN